MLQQRKKNCQKTKEKGQIEVKIRAGVRFLTQSQGVGGGVRTLPPTSMGKPTLLTISSVYQRWPN